MNEDMIEALKQQMGSMDMQKEREKGMWFAIVDSAIQAGLRGREAMSQADSIITGYKLRYEVSGVKH